MRMLCDTLLSFIPCVITSDLLADLGNNNTFTLMKNVTVPSDSLLSNEAAVTVDAEGAIIDLNQKVLSKIVDTSGSSTIGFLLNNTEITIMNGKIDGFDFGIETSDGASGSIFNAHISNQVSAAVLHSGTSFNIDRSNFGDCLKSCVVLNGDGPYSISNSIFKQNDITTNNNAIVVAKTIDNNVVSIRNNLIQEFEIGVNLSRGISSRSNILIESNCFERTGDQGISYGNRIGDGDGTIDIENNFIASGNNARSGITLVELCVPIGCSDVPPNVSNNCIGDIGGGPGIFLFGNLIPGTILFDNTFYNNTNRGDVCEGNLSSCFDNFEGYFLSQRENDDEARANCICPFNESSVGAGSMPVQDDDDEDERSSTSSFSSSSNSSSKKTPLSSLRPSSRNKGRKNTHLP